MNSDDGFEVSASPAAPGGNGQLVLGFYDNGRAADDTVFDFLVPTAGLYRFDLIVFESTGAASCEFYSVNMGSGTRVLINDSEEPASIRSFRTAVTASNAPSITRVEAVGGELAIEWVNGVPPFQVQTSPGLATQSWTNQGAPTTSRSARVPLPESGTVFVRVSGQ